VAALFNPFETSDLVALTALVYVLATSVGTLSISLAAA